MTLRSIHTAIAPCVGFGQRRVSACVQWVPGDIEPAVMGSDFLRQPGCDQRHQAGVSVAVRTQ